MDGLQSNSFNNLKHITLQWLPKLHHLWKTSSTPSQHHHMLSIFNNLSTISIVGCHSLRTLFSLPATATAASDCFSQLERLEIKFCITMEQVFMWEDEQNAAFPKLKWVSLFSLEKLTSVCKGSENIEFPVLEKMEVMFCPLLKSFDNASEEEEEEDDDDDFIHFFCKPDKVRYMFYVSTDGSINHSHLQVGLGCLKQVVIHVPRDTRRNWMWCPQIPTPFFAGLKELTVSRFEGTRSLFSCSIAGNLQNMRCLKISKCEAMVTVIEDEGEGEGEAITLFPKLEVLSLSWLLKLHSFCQWRCGLQFPSLNYLYIEECHFMHKFISGPLVASNLKTIKIGDHCFTDEDVNTALQLHHIKTEEEWRRRLHTSSDSDD